MGRNNQIKFIYREKTLYMSLSKARERLLYYKIEGNLKDNTVVFLMKNQITGEFEPVTADFSEFEKKGLKKSDFSNSEDSGFFFIDDEEIKRGCPFGDF